MGKTKGSVSSRLANRRRISVSQTDLYSGGDADKQPTPDASQAPVATESAASAPAAELPKNEVTQAAPKKGKPGRKKKQTAEEVVPFSSRMKPSYKRQIKFYALALGINEYDVLEQALSDYFAKHKAEKDAAL